MSEGPKHEGLPPAEFARAWRRVTIAGAMGASYFTFCVTGAPRVKFLTELQADALDFGVIAGLTSLALAFQVVCGLLMRHLRWRKPVWMALAVTHRIGFLLVLAAPALFSGVQARISWIIFVLFAHDALLHLGTPMWLSWMADLAPQEAMNRHWARRQRFVIAAAMLASVAMAFLFSWFEVRDRIVQGFVVIGILGVVLGLGDVSFFFRVPEPRADRSRGLRFWDSLLQPLRDPEFRPFVHFSASYYFAVMFSWPFFALYMVKYLEVSARDVQLMLTLLLAGMAASTRFWGLLCDTYGQKPALQIALLGKLVFPITFLIAPHLKGPAVALLSFALFVEGLMDAGVLLAMQGTLLKHTPRSHRPMYIAAANFFSLGLMAGIAPFLGGALIESLQGKEIVAGPYRLGGFHAVFGIGCLLRVVTIRLARRLHDPLGISSRLVFRHIASANPLRVTRALWQLNEAPDDKSRIEAARRLGEIGSPLAIHDLIRLLRGASDELRDAAAEALGRIGTADASAPLALALADPTPEIRSRAARVLARIGDTTSIQALLRNMKRLDPALLAEVVDSLGKLGDWSAILPLMCLLDESRDPALRRVIATALGRLSDIQSEEEVMALLGDPRPKGLGMEG